VLRDKSFQGLRELGELKRRLSANWAGVAFGSVDMDGLASERVAVGQSVRVCAELVHPNVDPELLEVQVVIATGPIQGQLDRFETFGMRRVHDDGGAMSHWETVITCESTGPHAIGLRAVPRRIHGDGDLEFELSLVKWL
jgi:hypothetical protein